jgi:PAS domain S-box-containing protein
MVDSLADHLVPALPAVIGVTRDRTVTLWSAGAEALYGIPAEEALGQSVLSLADWRIAPADVETCHLMRPGDVWSFQRQMTGRDGECQELKTTVTVALDSDGREELLFSWTPPTPAMPGESAGAGQVQHLAALTGPSSLTGVCSERMVVQYVSPGVQTTLGHLPRDLIGYPSIDTVHPDDRLVWQQAWDRAVSDPSRTQPVEIRRRTAGDEWRVISSELTNMLAYRDIAGVVIRSYDVTELRQTSAAFEASNHTLRSILQSSAEAVWVVDRTGAMVFANARMTNLLGISRLAMARYSVYDLFPDCTSGDAESNRPGARHYETTFSRPDGLVLRLGIIAISRFDTAGKYAGCVMLFTDLTGVGQKRSSEQSRHPVPRRPMAAPASATTASAITEIMGRLSTRETIIVRQLMRGDRVPTIAQTLFISQSTVRNQLASVFRKAKVNSQQELISLLRADRR